jgi:hypothetical protein
MPGIRPYGIHATPDLCTVAAAKRALCRTESPGPAGTPPQAVIGHAARARPSPTLVGEAPCGLPVPQGHRRQAGPYMPCNQFGAFLPARCVHYLRHRRTRYASIRASHVNRTLIESVGRSPKGRHHAASSTTRARDARNKPYGPVRTLPRTYWLVPNQNPCNHAENADKTIKSSNQNRFRH